MEYFNFEEINLIRFSVFYVLCIRYIGRLNCVVLSLYLADRNSSLLKEISFSHENFFDFCM